MSFDDDDELGPSDELVKIYDSIETFFLSASRNLVRKIEHDELLVVGLERIEEAIDKKHGDPGKLYPLDERVHRVIGALQDKIRVLESRGRR